MAAPQRLTLFEHLRDRYAAQMADPDESTLLGDFVAFCRREMVRNASAFYGYSEGGMTLTLQDGTCVLLSPAADLPDRATAPAVMITGHVRPGAPGDGTTQRTTSVPITGRVEGP